MWARRYLSQIQFILLLTLVAALPLGGLHVFAQEESATGAVPPQLDEADRWLARLREGDPA